MDWSEDLVYDSSDYLEPDDYDALYEDKYYSDLIAEHLEDERVKESSLVNLLTFVELLEQCVLTVISDVGIQLSRIFLLAIIFRLTTQIVLLPSWLSHALSFLLGSVGLFYFFGENSVHLINVSIASYIVLVIVDKKLGKQRGFATVLMTLFYNFACELWVASSHDWHQIRGAQMILCMKIISLAFDADIAEEKKKSSGKHKKDDDADEQKKIEKSENSSPGTCVPSILEYLGYLFCPGTCLFGPWIKFFDYCNSIQKPLWSIGWLLKILTSLMSGLAFLSLSTCFNQWIIPDNLGRWSLAYRDALAFRASHYFVSYMSEALAVTSGMYVTNNTKESNPRFNSLVVADPSEIEVPRSLTAVVKAWNVPMHIWLKRYCFRVMKPYGVFWAILWTYFCSTMLHGLNFQLGAVLFSLGFYTFAEHRLRGKLASLYSAPITASKPSTKEMEEVYYYSNLNIFVLVINFMFTLLAMFNLAYLGVMFSKSQGMAEGYSWKHTLAVWQELDFASSIIMVALFIVACFL